MEKIVDVVVKRVFFKEIPEDQYGNKFKRSIQIDKNDMWIDLGGGKNDRLNVKIGAGFKEVGEGTSIDLIKVDSREYEGKACYSAKMGNISWGDSVEPTKKPQRPLFNQAGIQTGHSLNCAVDFMVANNISFSQEELSELAKQFHTITEKMKVERKQRFPSLSDYDLSASTGQAVKAAASLVTKVGQVEKIALQILEVSKEIEEYIKTGGKEEEKPVVEKPKEDKSKATIDDMDDSIPF